METGHKEVAQGFSELMGKCCLFYLLRSHNSRELSREAAFSDRLFIQQFGDLHNYSTGLLDLAEVAFRQMRIWGFGRRQPLQSAVVGQFQACTVGPFT